MPLLLSRSSAAKQIVFATISKYVLSLGESTENYVSLHCY